ncbi:hypothetical protein KFL_000930150 [Klebsormidium nitens]|uniref:Expansin-like CBD domain-containing protein n=1 Tax=Klebsormidium nitens TaxID=105231 RepID=A0A1Y1HXG6_KLENI|nr:hypothetical protein KFL_000930150 [Klebsormidium nitens]|eukprot:GAQ81869.1 hypothetical protein KFL_000930150 [Klebsormidium nitens]
MARSFALSCLLLVCLTASSTFASGDYIPIGKPITLNATATLHGNGVGNATHKNIVALGPELFQVQSVDICRECPKYDFALSPSAFDQIVNETYQTGTLDIEIQHWGVNWVLNGHVTDSVSLRLTGGDGTQVTLDDCVPADWTPGSSYPCSGQLS